MILDAVKRASIVNHIDINEDNDLKTKVINLGKKIEESINVVKTEEATKMAFVLPFLRILGYDIANPVEVVPEYSCDFGIKKGEKVDYCIMNNGKPYVLIECKDCRNSLSDDNVSQLYRYFSVSSAKLALLTNGIQYMLFTDAREKNKMDTEPFYKFSILNVSSEDVNIIKLLCKGNINDKEVMSYSREALFKKEIDNWYNTERLDLSRSFVKYIKGVVNTYGVSDEVIKSVVSNKLFGDNGITSTDIDSTDTGDLKVCDNEKIENSKSVKSRKNAVGKTGIFSIGDTEILDAVSGSQLVFIDICEHEYDYNKIYQLLFAFIDYSLDILHINVSELLSKSSVLDIPILVSVNSASNLREYRGVAFKNAMSGQMVVKNVIKLCDIFKINTDSVKVGLLDKTTVQNFKSMSMDESLWKFYLKSNKEKV